MARALFSIALLFSLLFLPFWVSFVLILFGVIHFDFYIEGPTLLLVSDFFYAVPQRQYLDILVSSSLIGIILLLLGEFLKGKIRYYSQKR